MTVAGDVLQATAATVAAPAAATVAAPTVATVAGLVPITGRLPVDAAGNAITAVPPKCHPSEAQGPIRRPPGPPPGQAATAATPAATVAGPAPAAAMWVAAPAHVAATVAGPATPAAMWGAAPAAAATAAGPAVAMVPGMPPLTCGHEPTNLQHGCRYCAARLRFMDNFMGAPAPAATVAAHAATVAAPAATAATVAAPAATVAAPPLLTCGHSPTDLQEDCPVCEERHFADGAAEAAAAMAAYSAATAAPAATVAPAASSASAWLGGPPAWLGGPPRHPWLLQRLRPPGKRLRPPGPTGKRLRPPPLPRRRRRDPDPAAPHGAGGLAADLGLGEVSCPEPQRPAHRDARAACRVAGPEGGYGRCFPCGYGRTGTLFGSRLFGAAAAATVADGTGGHGRGGGRRPVRAATVARRRGDPSEESGHGRESSEDPAPTDEAVAVQEGHGVVWALHQPYGFQLRPPSESELGVFCHSALQAMVDNELATVGVQLVCWGASGTRQERVDARYILDGPSATATRAVGYGRRAQPALRRPAQP